MSTEYDFNKAAEPFKTASDMADDKLRGVLSKFSQWRSVVVLVAMGVMSLVIPLISMGFGDPLTPDFWFDAAYSFVIATMSYYIFIPNGTRSERKESSTYKTVVGMWISLSQTVRDEGLLEAFHKFCRVRREEERQETKELFVAAAGIPFSIYQENYEGLTKKELKAKRKSGELTKKQVKYLVAANGEIKVLPINPSMVLSGLSVNNINDVGREKKFNIFALVRPLTLILTMAVRSLIKIGGNEEIILVDYITQAATNLFVIVMWSFTGFRCGISLVRDEEQTARGRSEFLSMFLERARRDGLLLMTSNQEKPDNEEIEKSPT